MNCLIVDDSEIAIAELKALIKKAPFLRLIDTCTSGKKAYNILISKQVDLIFLDVLMPGMTGLDLLKLLNGKKPQVILVTQEKNYALDGYEYGITDFLLKPLSVNRFLQAVAKAKKYYDLINPELSVERSLFINTKDASNLKIAMEDIHYIEAQGNYITIHLGTAGHVVYTKMETIYDKLPVTEFIRTHRSYIVRLDKIKQIEGHFLILENKTIPVSRALLNNVISRLNIL